LYAEDAEERRHGTVDAAAWVRGRFGLPIDGDAEPNRAGRLANEVQGRYRRRLPSGLDPLTDATRPPKPSG
jgi:hypothetical protein